MTLPPNARERLAALLEPPRETRRPERDHHTVPIGQRAWLRYRDSLVDALDQFVENLPLPDGDFSSVRAWAHRLTELRARILSLLLAGEPFTPFDTLAASQLMHAVDEALASGAKDVREEASSGSPSAELRTAIAWWSSRDSEHSDDEIHSAAFGLPEPPTDKNGKFRADWALQHYAYNYGELFPRVLTHLYSLGIPAIPDILASVSIVGGLLECDDPVSAYAAMDLYVTAALSAPSGVTAQTLAHLRGSEGSLQRAKQMAERAFVSITTSTDADVRAYALADMYKRVTEGPFRQHAWALYCLRNGAWEPTPMLTSLRERLISAGGLPAKVAADVVIPGMRNSEAHETLYWDGVDEEFVTEAGRISPDQVAISVSKATSFVAGCEAGLAAVRALAISPSDTFLPDPDEADRMPTWRRALAYFGTNKLKLTYEQLNTKDAQLRVASLRLPDVNPCFQALLTAHRLLPRIETFTVSMEGVPDRRISVSAGALQATMPIWEQATSALDRMPFSTFLPMNFDARRRVESESVAIRSVAWIAIDDILDAIDGSPEYWDASVSQVITARLDLVETAVAQTALSLSNPGLRLKVVSELTVDLRNWVALNRPPSARSVERSEALRRLRLHWRRWGPVQRHPLVPEMPRPNIVEPQPSPHQQTGLKYLQGL